MKTETADFPDWFGPMLVKELRQGLKSRGFTLSFIALQLILIIVMIYHATLYASDHSGFDSSGLTVIFWMLIGAQLLAVTPLRALNELAAERKANTLELIFLSGLTSWRITLGKWVSLLFQAFLFVLAVLPYAILRYYFGSVNLTEDLGTLAMLLLSCATLTAIALALSGLPLAARIGAAILVFVFGFGGVQALFAFFVMGRMGMRGGSSMFSGSEFSWWLMLYNALLVCLIALEIGASTVAPAAENHAGRQRMLALLMWLPIPVLLLFKASNIYILPQLIFFAVAVAILTWHHLAARPEPMRSHVRPFRGWRVAFGIPFQPGWPSAVVFSLICVGLIFIGLPWEKLTVDESKWALASIEMACAAFFFPALFQVALRRNSKFPLVEQTIILIFCGVAISLMFAAKSYGTRLAENTYLAVVPPVALLAMQDNYAGDNVIRAHQMKTWQMIAPISMFAYAAVITLLGRHYWKHYFRLARTIKSAQPTPVHSTSIAP